MRVIELARYHTPEKMTDSWIGQVGEKKDLGKIP